MCVGPGTGVQWPRGPAWLHCIALSEFELQIAFDQWLIELAGLAAHIAIDFICFVLFGRENKIQFMVTCG